MGGAKGLPLDPKTNHLAVHTEDHPLEYATFEGDIPKGEYGGGQVIIWDRGTYECEKWTDREVKVVLHGERVEGRYVLFKTGDGDRDWMVHRMDPPPRPTVEPLPRSGRTRCSRRCATSCRATSDGWATSSSGTACARSSTSTAAGCACCRRNDRDVTGAYPELRDLGRVARLDAGRARRRDRRLRRRTAGPSFAALQPRMHVTQPRVRRAGWRRRRRSPTCVFDVLHLDGRSLLDAALRERRGCSSRWH